uniref:Uncharacterized protein n=1 Tax=Rhizophora mucronata TaxID=61149 RepID=A0A2P2QJ66_RHIMU
MMFRGGALVGTPLELPPQVVVGLITLALHETIASDTYEHKCLWLGSSLGFEYFIITCLWFFLTLQLAILSA